MITKNTDKQSGSLRLDEASCCASLAAMSRDERSLLLYLECRAVDHGGIVTTPQMNATDFENIAKWKAVGFVEFGRLTRESIEKLRGSTHWIKLSERAWALAAEERQARYERLNASRAWQTTEEKRSRHNATAQTPPDSDTKNHE